MPDEASLTVVAAAIRRDGKILIGQRKPNSRHPYKWEFPGGKVEPGEEPRAALRRELREELDIDAEIGDEEGSYTVSYGTGPRIRLLIFGVGVFSGEPRNLDFAQIAWVAPERLLDYDFLEGDIEFVKRLGSR
ncbi:MAG TPA: (deoxy)nucleoside triphosphate pyrophosphohydrolase [Bryobacteraceae bacterium]